MITVERLEEITKLIKNSTGGEWYNDNENLVRDKETNKFIVASKYIIYELLNEINNKNEIISVYEKALNFYAEKEHHEKYLIGNSDVVDDAGEVARIALSEVNNINKEK